MKLKFIIPAVLPYAFVLCPFKLLAQKSGESLPGIWKGTSICQVKNSPCHDEVVVYHISRGKGANEYSIFANKIVNGAEEEMGTLDFTFDPKDNEMTCVYRTHSIWKFKLNGDTMDGTLYSNGTLYRIIKLKKAN